MTSDSSFRIDYQIDERAWAEARSKRFLAHVHPTFDLFYGSLFIVVDGQSLLPGPYSISIADVACGFASILDAGFPDRIANSVFKQGDDTLEIALEVRDNLVCIEADGRRRCTSADAFSAGTLEFVRRFASQLDAHVPDAFAWEELDVLARFLGPTKRG